MPVSVEIYLAFVLACIAIVIVPGPTVTVIIANSLRHGARAGLANVTGTQAGLLIMIGILAAGLNYIVENLAFIFDWVRILGAAYLIWLGIKLWRDKGDLADAEVEAGQEQKSFFWQGFFVILSNPKALLFFGAFIPQFIDPTGSALVQTIALGLTFMAVATVLDGAYAVATGAASKLITRSRIRLLNRVSGSFLIGGGLWLALAKRQ